jgi:hypothetical protein
MSYIELIDSDIDEARLWYEFRTVLTDNELYDYNQISITSIDGSNDWFGSVGKIAKLKHPERYYSKLNKAFIGTYVEEILARYPQYYRWRAMKLLPKTTYTVHADHNFQKTNIRLHIPVKTNNKCFQQFFNGRPISGESVIIQHEHLNAGCSYKVDTTNLHSAVNYGDEFRWHIVGVRYEN